MFLIAARGAWAVLLLAGALWLLPPVHAQAEESALAREIGAIHARYLFAFNHRDAAALAALFAEDGLFIDPAGKATKGRAAIEAMFAQGFGDADLSLEANADEVGALGDGGWEVGHGAQTTRSAGATERLPLHYVALFQRHGGALSLQLVSVGAE
ncbi:MAG TPA: nuclear transport factor 2 family protein [Stellaceae bacterium]|nr:nuclear transport factor 2 family protein [Stellaceae bacterium]